MPSESKHLSPPDDASMLDVLATLPDIHSIDRVQTILQYPPGATIIEQGKSDPGFYILNKGAVEVYKDDNLLNVLMYPGTVFGEIAFILKKTPRTGTVKARTTATVTKYECDDIESLIREHPDVAVTLIETLASRLERTTQKLSDISTAQKNK